MVEKTHEEKVLEAYSHDYRDMKITQEDLYNILNDFLGALKCSHICSSNCRRNGCNCNCGEYHY